MTTAAEFARSGITGQTFREITEKFGKPFNSIGRDDPVMGNYAVAFAWFRDREHLPVEDAYSKAMSFTTAQIEELFEDPDRLDVRVDVDFDSTPPTAMP